MKKVLFLLLITSISYGQALFDKGIKITGGIATENTATKVFVHSANNVLNTIAKSDLIDVLEFASAINLPVTGVSGKIYVTIDNGKLYRWNGTVYIELAPALVTSVNGLVGSVVLTTANIADSTNKRYQTDAQQLNNDATSPIQAQLNSKAPATGSTSYIQNDAATFQSANFAITGFGQFGNTRISDNGANGQIQSFNLTPLALNPLASNVMVGTATDNNQGKLQVNGNITASTATLSNQVTTFGQVFTSPTFTGTPTAPTAVAGTNTTQLATTAFVTNELTSKSFKSFSSSTSESYGDSMTDGYGATLGFDYMSLFSSYFGVTNVNRAVSARGIWEAVRLHNLNINIGNVKSSVLMAGFNDVRRGGNAVKTISKIKNGYRAIIVNQFLKTFVSTNSGSSTITSSGTWTNYPSATYGGKSASLGGYNSIIGSFKQYNFTDNNVVVAFIGSDGVGEVHGNFDVHIDGVFKGNYTANGTTDGISDGSNDNTRAPFILYFGGLTDALHTIKITVTTANFVVIDYFGNLKAPRFTNPLFLVQAPKMNASGYATAPALATDVIINQLNSELTNVISEFSYDYPIINAKTNDYYNIANGLSADNIHPNDTGYRQIYSAIINASNSLYIDKPTAVSINSVRQISTATTLTDSDNGLVIILTGSATVTIPNGLVSNFECTLVTLTGATLTVAQGGLVTLLNNAGTSMAEKLSFTLKNTLTTNQYLTVGNL